MLNVIETGTDTGAPPLLIAHGLFGSARNWGVIAKRLAAEGRRVLAVDMRNHGQSPWFDSHDYPDMAVDLARVIEAQGPMDVLGHSMGGKAAMVLALSRPELVRKLIVADIAPVAYGHTQSHNIEAMRRVPLDRIESRGQAAEALAIEEPDVAAFLLQSLDMAERRWRLNLDVLDREMPKIVGWPGVEGRFDGSTLFLSGGASDYVTRDARPIAREMFPAARFASIPGAGHWLHAEKPREFEAALRAFLDAG
jgi:pimeloyl-ACP methyl ester carboxylesterase